MNKIPIEDNIKSVYELSPEQVYEMTTLDYQKKSYAEFVAERFYIDEWEDHEVIDTLVGIIDGDYDEMLQETADDVPLTWHEHFLFTTCGECGDKRVNQMNEYLTPCKECGWDEVTINENKEK